MVDEHHGIFGFRPSITADEVASRTFGLARRGFDQGEVRRFLERVSAALQGALQAEEDLGRRLAAAEEKVAHPMLDEATLTQVLGQETARVLQSARDAAAGIRAQVGAEVAEAKAQAEAHAAAMEEEITSAAKEHGRALVAEAQQTRSRILADLTEKRRVLQAQIDDLLDAQAGLSEALHQAGDHVRHIDDLVNDAEQAARRLVDQAGSAPDGTDGGESAGTAGGDAADTDGGDAADTDGGESAGTDGGDAELEASDNAALIAAGLTPGSASTTFGSEKGSAFRRRNKGRPGPIRSGDRAEGKAGEAPGDRSERKPLTHDPDEGVRIISTSVTINRLEPPLPTEAGGAQGEPELIEGQQASVEAQSPTSQAVAPPLAAEAPPLAAEAPPGDVDELFARMKTERAAATARAHRVLAGAIEAGDVQPASAIEGGTDGGTDGEGATDAGSQVDTGSDRSEMLLARRDSLVDEIITAMVRKVKRALQDEQNELLDRLRHMGPAAGMGILPSEHEQSQRYKNATAPLLEDASQVGAEFAGNGGAAKGSGIGEVVAAGVAEQVSLPLRRRLEEGMNLGITDESGIAEHIGSVYREWKGQRLERLVGDHVTAAFARGAMSATSEGVGLVWIVDDQGDHCPDCDDNALAGAVRKGDAYPTGQLHPPAHAGCRCLLAPAPA